MDYAPILHTPGKSSESAFSIAHCTDSEDLLQSLPYPLHCWANTYSQVNDTISAGGTLPVRCRLQYHQRYVSSIYEDDILSSGRWLCLVVMALRNQRSCPTSYLVSTGMGDCSRVSRVRTVLVFNQPPRLTQPGHPFVGSCSEYQRWSRLLLGKKL